MQMKQCANGHFYNAEVSAACPYCDGGESANRTVPLGNPGQPGGAARKPADGDYSPTMPPDYGQRSDNEKTQAVIVGKLGIDPVVGWLVCCAGKEKGKDYRLHDGNNSIGRNSKMDVRIDDEQLSRENGAWLAYDAINKKFLFGGGMGRNLVYVQNVPLIGGNSVELKPYDKIMLGTTTLIFIPLCGENFEW